VPSVEFLVLLGGIVGSLVISIWAHYKITQLAASAIAGKVQELNEALGEAIQLVGSAAQPENPLVGLITTILQKEADKPLTAKVIEQDPQGRFVKKNE
jgi:regulator of RNase E activity RraA